MERPQPFELTQRAIFSAARPQAGRCRTAPCQCCYYARAVCNGRNSPRSATSAFSAQVEALFQDAANMLTVDAASWTQKTDRIHLSQALANRLRDVLQVNVSDAKAFQALSLV